MTFTLLEPAGYCTDYLMVNGVDYDDVSNTPDHCMARCLELNPTASSFYLRGT